MQVIEELDNGKKGTSEASRNARQVSRFLNELVQESGLDNLADGIPRSAPTACSCARKQSAGKLRFQTSHFDAGKSFGKVIPDNAILGAILALKEETPDLPVVFVSKDINLRIKAAIAGIVSEDYENDRALDDFSLLYTGATELPEDFWKRHGDDLRSWSDKGRSHYEIQAQDGSGIRTSTSTCRARMKSSCASAAWSAMARWCCRWSMISATAATPCGASAHATASRTSRSTH